MRRSPHHNRQAWHVVSSWRDTIASRRTWWLAHNATARDRVAARFYRALIEFFPRTISISFLIKDLNFSCYLNKLDLASEPLLLNEHELN